MSVSRATKLDALTLGGDIRISTDSISWGKSSGVVASTFATGDAGSVFINAGKQVFLDGGVIASSVEPTGIGKGGDIRITTGSLSLTNGALISSRTNGQGNAGSVFIDANERISLAGESSVRSSVSRTGAGKGGDIRISTGSFFGNDAALIDASTIGKGDAGNVILDARTQVSLDRSVIASSVEQTGVGKGGDIQISTGLLSLTNGALLIARTTGQGDAGNIQINASDNVSFSGVNSVGGLPGGLFTSTDPNSTGRGGNITVNTNGFRVSNNATLSAITRNDSNAGNITVNASLVEIFNGGQLITATSSRGNAGKITVNANKQVIVNNSDGIFNDRIASSSNIGNMNSASGFFVLSSGLGRAGDIDVTSPKLILDERGRFIAESASGNGGNINLHIGDFLLLRRGSLISATAGTAQQGGDGGNISINTPFIIAVSNENSDITANAFTGRGGRVDIKAQGVYGIQSRPRQTSFSDITASSESGVAGTVQINTPEIDPSRGLVALPTVAENTPRLVSSGCAAFADVGGSSFTITGRGGLPPNPDEPFSSDVVWSDTRLPDPTVPPHVLKKPLAEPSKYSTVAIIPATGWVFNDKGEVLLVSTASNYTDLRSTPTCYER